MEPVKTRVYFAAIATCGLILALGSAFDGRFIAPLRQRETETLREVEGFGKRLAEARTTIAAIQAQEDGAERAKSELKRLQDGVPSGAASVAVPALVKESFARFGLEMPLVRLNPTLDEPELPGYGYGHWSVTLPIDETGRNIHSMLLAVSDLDQQNSFVRVLTFHIRPDYDNPGRRVGSLNLGALIRK